jgi:phosphoglycerate kinase
MSIPLLKQLKTLKGKRVLVRVDFNVPVKRKKILDDTKLLASLPTIQFLIKKRAKIVLVTHFGRPGGKKNSALKVDVIGKRLEELLGQRVYKLNVWKGKMANRAVQELEESGVMLLENIRFDKQEKNNTGDLAKELAQLADIFVLDGFAVAHRTDASIVGVAEHLPSYAGLLLEKEIKGLDKVLDNPKKPFVVALGGIKIKTKIPVIKQLLPTADHILIGGGLFNTYLKAAGYFIGSSVIDKDMEKLALYYCKRKKVITPVDVVVGNFKGTKMRVVDIGKKPHVICKRGEAILDIGPKTIQLFAGYLKEAKTLAWNGAMGYFEQAPYDIGTKSIARVIASRSKGRAYGIIGGGETIQAMDLVGMKDDIDLVSTGGGAMLQYLGGKSLDAIEALGGK